MYYFKLPGPGQHANTITLLAPLNMSGAAQVSADTREYPRGWRTLPLR